MDLKLSGKVAVVTGGSGGIGAAICKNLANEKAQVVVTFHRNARAAETVVQEIEVNGGSAIAVQGDVCDADSVRTLFERSQAQFGGIDILINCAGVASFQPLHKYAASAWDTILATNLKGTYLCCQAALSYFKQRGGGDIVNISSLAASTGSFEGGAYAASKAGVNALTLSLALELASLNIRVNAVAPGRIDTEFRRTRSGRYFEFMQQQTPQKRMGTTQEIANAVAFMASRACSFITGETLYVTGGLHSVYLEHVTPDHDSKLNEL
jgi:NAD(P)-dependent dehydrogenase (short-subunit alcohol dehydrogenase family)